MLEYWGLLEPGILNIIGILLLGWSNPTLPNDATFFQFPSTLGVIFMDAAWVCNDSSMETLFLCIFSVRSRNAKYDITGLEAGSDQCVMSGIATAIYCWGDGARTVESWLHIGRHAWAVPDSDSQSQLHKEEEVLHNPQVLRSNVLLLGPLQDVSQLIICSRESKEEKKKNMDGEGDWTKVFTSPFKLWAWVTWPEKWSHAWRHFKPTHICQLICA